MTKKNNNHKNEEKVTQEKKNLTSEITEENGEQLSEQELLEKYDRESTYRKNIGKWTWVVSFIAIYLTLFHLYTGYFGTMQSQIQGAVHVGTALGLIFLLYPAKKGLHKNKVPWYDVVLAFTAIFVGYFKIIQFDHILDARVHGYETLDIIVSVLGVLLLLEATRRCVGLPIVIVASVVILYALFGNHIPAQMLSHAGFSFEKVMTDLWFRENAIFGIPVQVSSKFIFLFLLFGVLLIHSGVGKFFNDIAYALTGRFTGGTAKAAVTASALQGMVSGSSIANTVASGSFTIPMMKKAKFKPEFAAATEASASTGGQLMPPIMGAAAFIMIEYTGTSYGTIMLAALIPSLLYFSGIFMGTHYEAKKQGIFGLSKDFLPNAKELFKRKGYMLLPLIAIVGTLFAGFTPQRAALSGILVAFLASFVRKEDRMNFKQVLHVLEQGARVALPVIAAVGTAGIIAGVVGMTGLGGKIASGIITLSNGILPLALFFTMIACIILGMGLPTTANYVVTATVAAPALINGFGVDILAAHLFVFYFGIVADITPPVCLAAYAGAGIARANPFKAGVTAVKLAIAAFIIPYIFVFNPILVQSGDYNVIVLIIAVATALLGMMGVSSSIMGYFKRKAYGWERLVLLVGGLMLIVPENITNIIGLVLIAGIWMLQSQRPDDSQKIEPSLQA
ncbi:TRAP transporter permease [Salinibacillus xinjiangensis]|uniref:TRAP transporter fused permease subunit n=1 Tax=Salinibacillus xinjiangensis TaxID=1229268 RepID=A0A6G1X608_9BACI|nr:TRAP transporter permease [Salinibacillus xinjiangensis]MRG86372.1 TRAP transporter fused permease subunit [Salinibacillus xinjiangensis]